MIYRIGKILRDVRTALDENDISEGLLREEDRDTLSIDEIIISKIEEGARRVELEAPSHLLEEGHNFGETVYWSDDGSNSGWVLLPDDFMRLTVFEMSDWERKCYEAILPGDPRYAMQSSRLKGIRGNAEKPVCAIVSRPEGKALEFYSCRSEDAYVKKGEYVPYPKIDRGGGIDISERCYEAVVYMTAGLTLLTLGEAERSAGMVEAAKGLIG